MSADDVDAAGVDERPARVSLRESVDTTLAELALPESDAALEHLARLYARQIDGAGIAAARADKALRLAEEVGDETLGQLVDALRTALAERTTLDRIGARLHAALVELGATPRARTGKSGTPSGAAPSSPLDRLRAQRQGLSA